MSEQQLRELVDRLTEEVNDWSGPAEQKAEIQRLIDAIEVQLAAPQPVVAEAELTDEVNAALVRFEAEHPTVAGILRRIMVTLSSMGV